MTNRVLLGVAALILAGTSQAQAGPIFASSYDMRNGHGVSSNGSFNYWDLEYSGNGSTNVDNAPLSGGLGNLTDGIIANLNWLLVENVGGTGPYVGWRQSVLSNPKVTFRFGSAVALDSLTIYVDDSNGQGGVSPPSSVDIGLEGGPYVNFLTPDPLGFLPTSYTFSGLGLLGSAFDVVFNHSNEWVFVSEVTFDDGATQVPEPATAMLILSGLTAITLRRRKRA